MKVHELKTWKEYFAMVQSGVKTFEVRRNDRDFRAGDELLLKEWDDEKEFMTGRFLHRRIDYVLDGGQFGIQPGYCVMQMSKL